MNRTTLPLLLICVTALLGCATSDSPPLAEDGKGPASGLAVGETSSVDSTDLQAALDQFLVLPPELQAYLDREIRPLTTEEARFRALRQWAFEEFQSQYTYDPGFTSPIDRLDESGRINCFSFSNMFVAAARYVDVPAKFQLVDSPPQWNMSSDTFVVSQHINVTGLLRRTLAENEQAVLRGQMARSTGTRIEKLNWDKLNRSYIVDLNPSIAVDSYRSRTISDREALSLYYSNRSVESLLAGKGDQALAFAQQAILTDDQSVTAWSNLGVILSRAGKTDAAKQVYLKALDLDGSAETAANNLERIYRRTGETRKADALAARSAARRKRNPYYHYSMGETMLEEGDLERAQEHFEEAIARQEDERLFYYGLAKAQIRLGDYERATRNLEQAKEYSSTADLWRYEQLSAELRSASHNG